MEKGGGGMLGSDKSGFSSFVWFHPVQIAIYWTDAFLNWYSKPWLCSLYIGPTLCQYINIDRD